MHNIYVAHLCCYFSCVLLLRPEALQPPLNSDVTPGTGKTADLISEDLHTKHIYTYINIYVYMYSGLLIYLHY